MSRAWTRHEQPCRYTVPPNYHFKGPGKATAMKEQPINNQDDLRKDFECIFCPLDMLLNHGKLMLCADGQIPQCYPVICAWTTDHFKNFHLISIKQPYFPVLETPKSSCGEGNSQSWQLRDYWRYFQKLTLVTQGDETERWKARQCLEHWAVGNTANMF